MFNPVRFRLAYFAAIFGLLLAGTSALVAQTDTEQAGGQTDLDAATELKLSASSMADLEKVISLCESAIEKGLDSESESLAKSLVTATLFQHGSRFAQALFDPRERNQRPQMLKKFALTDLYKILKYDDELPQVHMMIARLEAVSALPAQRRAADPNWQKGLAAADRAIELLEDDNELRSKALVLRAGYELRDNTKRTKFLNQAIEADAKNLDAWRLRGKNRLVEGELLAAGGALEQSKKVREMAIADFTQLLDENPDDPDALQAVAELMSRLGNNKEALAKADRAIEKNKRAPSLYILRGRIHHEQREYETAIKDFNRAIDLQPDSHIAFLDRMESHFDSDDKDAAARDFGRARELLGAQGLARSVLQRVTVRAQNKSGKAIEELQRFIDVDELNANETGRKPDFDFRLQLAETYSLDQKPLEAIKSYSLLLERVGNSNSSVMRRFKQAGLEGRANAYLGIGKHEEAIADYEAVLKIDPNGDGALNNLAWVLATSPADSLRDGERAIELATKACEVTEYNAPHILSTLAAAYAESDNWEEAVKRSTEAVDKLNTQLKQQEDTRKIPPTPLQLETQKQLQNELKSYEEKKPWRESQNILEDKQ